MNATPVLLEGVGPSMRGKEGKNWFYVEVAAEP